MQQGRSIVEAAGSLIVGGYHGQDLPTSVSSALREGRLGGTVLFSRNIVDAGQLLSLNEATQAAVNAGHRPQPPAFICVDQEGGPVARLRGIATDVPAMRRLGALDDPGLCRAVGRMMGHELRALGFNCDFAPVLDVDTNPANPIIGERAFGSDPECVGRLGLAFAMGLKDAKVAACGKHFPGHGDTDLDSHLALPVIRHGVDRLRAVEWHPFRTAISAGLPMIMTAHIVVEALDASQPATLSSTILRGHLRGELGFEGLIVSDDLEMAAIADSYAFGDLAEAGLAAGLDVFLVCHSEERQLAVLEGLIRAAERSPILRGFLFEAAERVLTARQALPRQTAESVPLRDPKHIALLADLIDVPTEQ